MAEYLAIPSNVRFLARGNVTEKQFPPAKTPHVPPRSNFRRRSCKDNQLSPWKASKLIDPRSRMLYRSPKQETRRCCCLSTLVNADVAITSEWVPIMDQVLLLASITLTYMAGVIPAQKSLYNTQRSNSNVDVVPENSSSSGSAMAVDDVVYLRFAWDVVRAKLMDSLSTIKNEADLRERVAEFNQNPAKEPSSLCAVAEGPRLRLLWASFQWLNKEAGTFYFVSLDLLSVP